MSALPVLRPQPARRPLPGFPCPHGSACCRYGTTVSDEEAAAIQAHHGERTVYCTRWGEWRTRVRQGYCVFHASNRCLLYDQPYYPAVCRGFPWTDAESGGPYRYDQTICPEMGEDGDDRRRRARGECG